MKPGEQENRGQKGKLWQSNPCLDHYNTTGQRSMPLNRTQELIWRALHNSSLEDEELVLEALLRRGFLAYRDGDGLWLGTGSHRADLLVLALVPGISTEQVAMHRDRFCKISLQQKDPHAARDVARTIIALPEHHIGKEVGGFSGFGLNSRALDFNDWKAYARTVWGARLPVCPATSLEQTKVYEGLDIGIALLVKNLPLANVVTCLSCDGHGIKPAFVSFCFKWDSSWGQAVFSSLPDQPMHSKWEWGTDLKIHPANEYGDESVTLMLEDIQKCARQLLDIELINQIAHARRKTLSAFCDHGSGPSIEEFRMEALRQLEETCGSSTEC